MIELLASKTLADNRPNDLARDYNGLKPALLITSLLITRLLATSLLLIMQLALNGVKSTEFKQKYGVIDIY